MKWLRIFKKYFKYFSGLEMKHRRSLCVIRKFL